MVNLKVGTIVKVCNSNSPDDDMFGDEYIGKIGEIISFNDNHVTYPYKVSFPEDTKLSNLEVKEEEIVIV